MNTHVYQRLIMVFLLLMFAGLSSGQTISDSKQIIETPTIENLHTQWWAYIEADAEQTDNRLNTLLQSHPEPDNKESSVLIKQIKARMDAWAAIQKTKPKSIDSITTPNIKEESSFMFDKHLYAIQTQNHLATLIKEQGYTIDDLKQNLKSITKEYDRLTALRLQKDELDTSRALDALLIIDEQIKVNIVKEKIKLAEQRKESIETLIQAEKAKASTEPSFDKYTDVKKTLEAQLLSAQQKLKTSKEKLSVAQLKNAHNVSEKGRGYAQEKLINSNVLLAELKVDQAALRLDYSRLMDEGEFSSLKKHKEHLKKQHKNASDRSENIHRIKKQAIVASEDVRYLLTDKIESDDASIDKVTLKDARQALKNYRTVEFLAKDLTQINDTLINRTANNFLYKGSLKTKLKNYWNTIAGALGYSLFKIGSTPVTAFGLLRLLLIIFVAYKLSKYIRKVFERISTKEANPASGVYAVGRLLQYTTVVAGILIALSSIGVDFTKLAIFAGALSVGIGFGLQSIVNNFVSGLILLFERTLRVGDVIEMDTGVMGKVKEINVRSTLVTTADNIDLIVPNAELMNNKLINWTLKDKSSRVHIPFGVAYGTDKELVKEAALEAAKNVPFVVKNRTPYVWLVNFGDNSLDFELIAWVDFSRVFVAGSIKPTFLWEIETELSKRGIEIPFPQRDLHLRSIDEGIQLTPPSVMDEVQNNSE